VELELQAWYRNEYDHLAEQFDLRKRVFDALNRAGVAMPYETIEVRTGPEHPFQIEQPSAGV
jgi:small conductance mechanosensitive channel